MYSENSNERENDFSAFLRTILMVLENHNFKSTVVIFRDECQKLGYNIFNSAASTSAHTFEKPLKITFENLPDSQPYKIVIENKKEPQNRNESTTQSTSDDLKAEKVDKSGNDLNGNIEKTEKESKNTYEVLSEKNNINIDKEGQNSNLKNTNNTKINNNNASFDLPHQTSGVKIINKKIDSPEHDALKSKFSNLQTEHQKLIDLVTDLTYALQTSIKGQTERTKIILNNCETKYPELFSEKPKTSSIVDETEEKFSKYDEEERETTTAEETTETNKFINNDLKLPMIEVNTPYSSYFYLNYKKIKHDLQYGDMDTKLLLLQALRWRITKTSEVFREQSLQEYKFYDLLNIHNCQSITGHSGQRNSIIFITFFASSKSPQQLQESLSRLINALASFNIGRDYITENSLTLDILLSLILDTDNKITRLDVVTKNMIVATLQKISLRYQQRVTMIEEGLTEYLVTFLNLNYNKINEYCLEYSVALLRNLLLHKNARDRCKLLSKDVINLSMNLLQEKYIFCIPYIRVVLYYILTDQYFYNIVKELRFEEVLQDRLKNSAGKIKEDLKSIIHIYSNTENSQQICECGLKKDTDDIINVLEPEIDENEVKEDAGGEYFLENYKLGYSNNDSEFDSNFIRNFFQKPVTPNNTSTYNPGEKFNMIPEIEYLEYAAEFLSDRMNEKVLSIENQVQYKEIHVKEQNLNDTNMENNENTETVERTFCEETQQYYYTPTKNGIFETDNSKNIYVFPPTFAKNIGSFNARNVSKSLPISPRNQNDDSTPSSAQSGRQFLSPTNNFSGVCYRETFKTRSFSDSSTPHIGFCNEQIQSNKFHSNKYSCSCFSEIQRSFDEEAKKISQKKTERNNFTVKTTHKHIETNKLCKYKYYPVASDSTPPNSSPKKEKEPQNKSLDESDYSSVFESRPKILRTP